MSSPKKILHFLAKLDFYVSKEAFRISLFLVQPKYPKMGMLSTSGKCHFDQFKPRHFERASILKVFAKPFNFCLEEKFHLVSKQSNLSSPEIVKSFYCIKPTVTSLTALHLLPIVQWLERSLCQTVKSICCEKKEFFKA